MNYLECLFDKWDPDHNKDCIKYYDTHTLLVTSEFATNEQLADSLEKSLSKFRKEHNIPLPCNYITNLIVGRNGRFYGFGYLRVSNHQVYYLLLGKNIDGSDRVVNNIDPNWSPPSISLEDALNSIEYRGTSWADWADQEDEVVKNYIPPVVIESLPPLLILDNFNYNSEQKKKIKLLCDEKNLDISIPDTGYFKVYPAFVPQLDDNYSHNVICCRDVPSWVKDSDFKKIFEQFTTDFTSKVKRKINGSIIYDTYPFITLNNNNMVFITFDYNTHDAQFALLMTKKYVLHNKNNKNMKVVLNFTQSYKSKNQRD